MPIIRGLHHAQVSIPKGAEEAGKAFYCGVLGLPELEKPEALKSNGGFWLQVGDRQVHIGTEDNVDRLATKAHLAYEVDDVEAWQGKLEEQGIKVLESIAIPGLKRFEFRDPFGNRVEMTQIL